LLKNEKQRWGIISDEIKETRKAFGQKTELGKRRTDITDAPEVAEVPMESMVEKEPITVICSEKGWIRAVKGHVEVGEDIRFKEGDRSRFALHALTTDKLVLFATNGRFYTLGGDKVPRGRGHGEPVRLLTGLGNDDDIIELLVHVPGRKLIVASSDGRGFVVPEDQLIAQTKTGKQVLNVSGDREAQALAVIKEGDDNIACVGENRKLIIFALDELPEMSRGRGVVLQKYKDGNLSDIQSFKKADGLTWAAGVNRTRTENDLLAWEGKRAQAGRMAPKGFAVTNRFS